MAKKKLSKVGQQTAGGLACPNCGSTAFKAKRSAFGKTVGAMFGGVGVGLAPKSRVKCEACGKEFTRG